MDPIRQTPALDSDESFSQAQRGGTAAMGSAGEAASKMASNAKASVAEFASNAADLLRLPSKIKSLLAPERLGTPHARRRMRRTISRTERRKSPILFATSPRESRAFPMTSATAP